MTVLLKPKSGGRPIVVDKPIILIGRHPDCDIIIESSPKISRKHCCIARVDERCLVRDLESMNGVWVNGQRTTVSTELFPGDVLMIGDVPFDVVQSRDLKAAPAPKKTEEPGMVSGTRRTVPMDDRPEIYSEEMLRDADASEAIKFSESLSLPFSEQESGDGYPVSVSDSNG